MLKKIIFLIIFLFMVKSCKSSELAEEDFAVQARIYATSYIKHFDLENFNSRFYYYVSAGKTPGEIKLDEFYHIDVTSNTISQIKIISEPLELQFYKLLRKNGIKSFTQLAPYIEKEVVIYKPSSCKKIESIVPKILPSIEKRNIGKLSLDVNNRMYIFQHKYGTYNSVKKTIATSDTSLPVVKIFLELKSILKECTQTARRKGQLLKL